MNNNNDDNHSISNNLNINVTTSTLKCTGRSSCNRRRKCQVSILLAFS